MADAARGDGSNWPATLLVIFAGVGVLGRTEPWNAITSVSGDTGGAQVAWEESPVGGTPTRLWEDPLRPRKASPKALVPAGVGDAGSYQVVAVCLPGGFGVESVELRQRMRFAVHSGFGASGYLPVLGARVARCSNSEVGAAYEWCAPEQDMPQEESEAPGTGRGHSPVLLVWIDEQWAQSVSPQQRVVDAVRAVERDCGLLDAEGRRRGSDPIRVIGPTNSDELLELVTELEKPAEAASYCLWFSPRATIPLETPASPVGLAEPQPVAAGAPWYVDPIRLEAAWRAHAAESARPEFARFLRGDTGTSDSLRRYDVRPSESDAVSVPDGEPEGVTSGAEREPEVWSRRIPALVRTIAPDDLVAERLVEELCLRRGDDLVTGDILLVVEQNTAFGRAWAGHLRDHLPAQSKAARIDVVHYPRGLDGVAWDGVKVAGPADDARSLDLASGSRHLDHLRRLQTRIAERGHDVVAVGVFGTDVYDKIRVLRALRPVVPDATFFTSDLDAVLLHPRHLPWTRNLLVASSHGLEPPTREQLLARNAAELEDVLCDHLPQVQPPFRDNYQSSVFVATQRALAVDSGLPVLPVGKEARVYEISNDGAIALDDPHGGGRSLWLLVVATMVVVVLTFLVFTRRGELAHMIDRRPRLFFGTLALTVVLPLVLGLLIESGARDPEGEPFAFAAGISIWPTEILRLGCCLLAVWFTLLALCRVERTETRVGERYGLHRSARKGWAVPSSSVEVWAMHRYPRSRFWSRFSPPVRRLLRAVGLAVVAFFCALLLMLLLGRPVAPARGGFARGLDLAVVVASVGAMQILLFLVFDLCRSTSRLLQDLGEHLDRWPDNDEHARRIGLDAAEAARVDYLRITRELTSSAQSAVFFPAVVILFMVLSRNVVFDAWTWPSGLIVVVGASALITLAGSLILGWTARRIRDEVVVFLDERQRVIKAQPDTGLRVSHLKELRDEFGSMEGSAFATLGSHPAVRALLIPTGGIGGITLIEWVSRMREFGG